MDEQLLMIDSTRSNGPAEIVMDYIISYTLRSAFNNETKPLFEKAARSILFKLLGKFDQGQQIIDVKVWKQWKRIDLTVEVTLKEGDSKEKHVIIIEDKYYSAPHDNQLQRYKESAEEYYKDEWKKHYVVITAVYRSDKTFDDIYSEVEKDGFNIYSLNELVKDVNEPTESDIFNQFWLADWH